MYSGVPTHTERCRRGRCAAVCSPVRLQKNGLHDMRLNSGYTRVQLSQPFREVQRQGQGAGQMSERFLQKLRAAPVDAGNLCACRAVVFRKNTVRRNADHRSLAWRAMVNLAGNSVPAHRCGQVNMLIKSVLYSRAYREGFILTHSLRGVVLRTP